MPATTTVRVHAETRDQLRLLAENDQTTMPSVIADLAQRELDRRMVADTFAAMDAMTPAERAGYLAELAAWDATLLDGLEDDPYPLSRAKTLAAEPAQRDVWLADLDPAEGHEQGGPRPVVVLSVDGLARRGLAIVIPTTTTDRGLPLHLAIEPPEGGLRERSFAMSEMIRSISTSRLAARWGSVGPDTHAELVRRLRVITQPTS